MIAARSHARLVGFRQNRAAFARHAQGMRGRSASAMTWTRAAVVLVAATASQGGALAQDVCIVCEEPRATYRCIAQDGPTRPSDAHLQLVCITEIAKSGGHASCSASRKQTGPCEGVIRQVVAGAAPPVLSQPPGGAPDPAQGEAAKKPKGPPETVEELAKQTAKSTKEQIVKAGDSVGGAAKKSWRCLTSLFKDC